MKLKCKFCTKKTSKKYKIKSSFDIKSYDIFYCKFCKSSFVHPTPNENEIEEYYKKLQNLKFGKYHTSYERLMEREIQFPNASIDARRIIKKIQSFTSNKDLLDIGAGHGFISKEAKLNNFKVTALEINKERSEIFYKMTGIRTIKKMFNNDFANKNLEKFDVVIASQLLEHISDTQNFLENIFKVLKRGGICLIAVPNSRSITSMILGKRDFFLIPPEHLNFFSIKCLRILFQRNNLKMLKYETISRITLDRYKKISKIYFIQLLFYYTFKLIFQIFDYFNKGMITNCYFKK